MFKLYVITLKQPNRLLNIQKQQEKIQNTIEFVDAVNGDLLNDSNIDPRIILHTPISQMTRIKKREIGCYLSHYRLYNTIVKDDNYTIVFEDDFDIRTNDLLQKCNTILNTLKELNLDFDIIFLGNHDYNHNHGTLIKNDIYRLGRNEGLHGTQGYIVNNNNIHKLIEKMGNITDPIDNRIQRLANEKQMNVFAIYPYYVGEGKIPSIIRAKSYPRYSLAFH
jgi:GR25 family glycosyltransferase involved in LPS biosynthesis